jgi:hypothetical protein
MVSLQEGENAVEPVYWLIVAHYAMLLLTITRLIMDRRDRN